MVLSFRKYLYWSLGLHFGILVLLIASPYLPFKPYRIRPDKIVWVSLPKGTTDQWGSPLKKTEGLPKTTIEEQKKAMESPPSGEKKPAMTYTPPPFEKKVTEKPKESPPKRPGHPMSRIDQALARIQKEAAVKKAPPEAAQIPETQPGGFTFGSATGQYVSPDDPEYVLYQAKIRHRIMTEWILPMKFAEQDLGLICKIIVHINDRGEVTKTEWAQRSGNPSFDMSAMRSVEKASPLDMPPDRLKWEVFNEGFIVEFKPQQAQQAAP